MKLADRMKIYEKTFSFNTLKRMPLIIRVDGRAFHSFTSNLTKPFDVNFMNAMINAAIYISKDMHGFKVAYIQSDEVTFFLTDYDNLETEGWFGYKLNKIVSISAALMSVAFNMFFSSKKLAVFDSRAFTVPKEEVVNIFLWRAKDWQRNSIQMYAKSFFSYKELHGKKCKDIHEMLYQKGKNWATDLSDRERNGTFIINDGSQLVERNDIIPTFESINNAIHHLIYVGS